MAKNETGKQRVVWHLSNDGLKPSPAPWGFMGRNPFERVIPPNGKIQVNLQVRANVPLLAFPSRSHLDDVTVPQIIPPDTDIVVTVENRSQHTAMSISDKEALVGLFPLVGDFIGEEG